jgi:hypothetical protein
MHKDGGLGFCFLKDQEPLSPAAHERLLPVRATIRGLIEGRSAYLGRTGLDPEVHLPQANWDLDEDLHELYRVVLAGGYSVLNNLRLFTQIFSGFQLLSLSNSDGLPIPREVPADLDERLAALARSTTSPAFADVRRYIETVRHLPEVLHISPPAR